jgi:hypothetical protein
MSRAIPLLPLWALRGLLEGDLYLKNNNAIIWTRREKSARDKCCARFPAVAERCTVRQVKAGEFAPGACFIVMSRLQYTHLRGSAFVLQNKRLSKLATMG